MKKFSTDEFSRDLARIAAKQLKRLPQAERESAMYQLMDNISLFSPYTYQLLKKELGAHPSSAVERAEALEHYYLGFITGEEL